MISICHDYCQFTLKHYRQYYRCDCLKIYTQVLVIGDSHARRLRDQTGNYFRCREVDITFRCQGGARTSYLKIPQYQQFFDIIMFVIGSNDLADGRSPYSIFKDVTNYAQEYVNGGFANRVVIMTLLPRNDAFYMSRLNQFNHMLITNSNDTVVGWQWSKKLKFHIRFDGVHLTDSAYKKAVKYLGSPIFYFCKPSSKHNKMRLVAF